jgi:hypothetical protein
MKEIGGFFELELNRGKEFHENAVALNSARNCLRIIIRNKGIKRLLVPFFICDAVVNALQAEAVEIKFYNIDDNFSPLLKGYENDFLLYINYFGICSRIIGDLIKSHSKLIIDNAQAFYSKQAPNIDTFNSPRKFFGVPDGGYVYCSDKHEYEKIETSISFDQFEHLVKRIDLSARDAYSAFRKAEDNLDGAPIRKMSNLTKALLRSIDYETIREKRLENFAHLHHALGAFNELSIKLGSDDVPLVYPFLTKTTDLRKRLIQNSIYVATYWPDPKNRITARSREDYLVSNLVPLAIDQRYGKEEMDYIIAMVKDNLQV